MNRAVFALVAILFLPSVSSISGLIQTVKADSETIYINADGSITPSTAPIHVVDNITYTLTGNITANADGIVIVRNNIVLNGAGYTVTGSGNGPESWNGTTLTNVSNVTVRNVTVKSFTNGIWLVNSSNSTLSGNNVANNYYGIWLWGSSNNVLSGNNVTANSNNGIWLDSSSGNTLSGNNVTANSNNGIWLDSSSGNTLSGNNVTANNDYCIWADHNSSNNTIYQNNFINNTYQVYSSNLTNVWDNGSVGNYWSDYLTKYPNATQIDSSGVWSTPYLIDTNNTDNYPLTVPIVVIPEFPSIQATIFFMLFILLAVAFYKKKGVKTSQS